MVSLGFPGPSGSMCVSLPPQWLVKWKLCGVATDNETIVTRKFASTRFCSKSKKSRPSKAVDTIRAQNKTFTVQSGVPFGALLAEKSVC